jgi:hypothetical protein
LGHSVCIELQILVKSTHLCRRLIGLLLTAPVDQDTVPAGIVHLDG